MPPLQPEQGAAWLPCCTGQGHGKLCSTALALGAFWHSLFFFLLSEMLLCWAPLPTTLPAALGCVFQRDVLKV